MDTSPTPPRNEVLVYPKRFRHYKVGDVLGNGSSGRVCIGISLDDPGTKIALKFVPVNTGEAESEIQRHEHLLCLLDHPNIVKYLGRDMAINFIGFQFEKLSQYRPPRSGAELRRWICQSLAAVVHLHDRAVPIVHRNINKKKLLIDQDNVKLGGFVKARQVMSASNVTPQVGQAEYRAPEILLGSNNYTTAVDIWSLGVIYAEWCTGRVPFLPGDDDQLDEDTRCLNAIFGMLGIPTEEHWPGVSLLPKYLQMSHATDGLVDFQLSDDFVFEDMTDAEKSDLKTLIQGMLKMVPEQRINAKQALHRFFTS